MKIKRITKYSERVFKAVLRMLPQLSSDADLPDRQYFKAMLAAGNTYFFIAELDDKQIAGMLTIGICHIPSGKKVWIEDVVVDESQRGKGIGKELILFALAYSASFGAKTINLTSRPARTAANKLYRQIGFEQYETNVYKYFLE
jgi:ribosomal protein S18 acetylase RimI-like enzyme